ncbi:hypothetical protein KKF05_04710 [Patescibacteria group bacterium]|nr:hypothetical protein [Patescibacteria group bacterium]MBU1028781.1 hypothetical protein [Patescibacteria group bacterium]MBU1916000.1 hypothetical protein [Patescibacteria group bacterium]
MDRLEISTIRDGSLEQNEAGDSEQRGVQLGKFFELKDSEIDETTFNLLKLMLEQYNELSHIEVVFIPPEETPDTGGFFHRIQVDEKTFIPTIFIVSEDQEHLQRLKDTRRSSSQRVADLLGVDFSQLSPRLLRQFIIAHEMGHANDYVKNYETNPEYQGSDAAEEWDVHYEANLLTMPASGFDPVSLREEVSKFESLGDFLAAYPDVAKIIEPKGIKTVQDLFNAQEVAYRTSPYESQADNFAADFLRRNAKELNISELANDGGCDEAA